MASWAGMLATPTTAEPVQPDATLKDRSVAVVDANAIIGMGYAVRSLADILFTTEDILKEIRDGKSRQVVDQIDFTCRNPSDEAVKAVSQFARKTGDLHQLSLEDLRLLALTYMLETQEHGSAHLRTEPVQVKKFTKQTARGALPGWGTSGQSDEWAAIDAIEDLELAEAEAAEAAKAAEAGEGQVGYDGGALGEGADAAEQAERADDEAHDSGSDAGEWAVARRSTNAFRKQNRKATRKAEREAFEEEDGEPETACEPPSADAAIAHFQGSAAAEGATPGAAGTGAPSTSAGAAEAPGLAAGERPGAEDECEEGSDEEGGSPGARDDTESQATTAPAFESNICLVTADFPMQNVCLQMGLRLVARDGLRITHLQRFVMRCEGCATVCKDTSKIFCPACGHATLRRVEVSIGQDGAEHYGIRKKHILKGTRYALPKPRGGRNQPNPILSEDVYNAKVRKPKKKAATDADDPFDGSSFGEMKKYANQPSHIAAGLAHLTTSARQNPNERASITRSNRRKR